MHNLTIGLLQYELYFTGVFVMLKLRNILLLSSFFIIAYYLPLTAELKITPVANISLLGGQYFLEGETDSFTGNANIFFSPVINFSEKTALLPIYQGIYSGTKDVKEFKLNYLNNKTGIQSTKYKNAKRWRYVDLFYYNNNLAKYILSVNLNFLAGINPLSA